MTVPVRYLLEDLNFTGLVRQASLLAPHFANNTLYSLQESGPLKKTLSQQGIAVESFDLRSPFRPNAWKKLRKTFLPSDFIHVWGLNAFRRLALARANWAPRPVLLSLTGHEKLNSLDRFFWKHVQQVFVPHEEARRLLFRQLIPPSQITVVPYATNSLPEKPSADDRAQFLRSLGIPADSFILMTNGRMPDRDRLNDAVWAFEVFRFVDPQIHCLVVGDGEGRSDLESFSRQIGYDDNRVHFLGYQPDAASLWRYADVAILPHSQGGLNAAIEAMAARLPIIATKTTDFSSILDDGQNAVLIPPGDQPAMAAAIRSLRVDPTLRDRLGTNAFKKASAQFVLQPILSQWETIYTA
jgi:glycosyltransferase involved in cell wall biosynthesis